MSIEFYTFKSITKYTDSLCIAEQNNGNTFEVYYRSQDDDTDKELKDKGFALCDADNWHETMIFNLSDLV